MCKKPGSIDTAVAGRERRGLVACASLLALLCFCVAANAQQQHSVSPFTGNLVSAAAAAGSQTSSGGKAEEEEFIKPSRPGVAMPAEIQKPGVLQLEFGYDANFRSEELHEDHSLPLTLRFAATKRLLLELDIDVLKSVREEEGGPRMSGVGDTRLGFQVVALEDNEEHPALAFAYFVKAPSASESKGLGTGRFDHKLVALLGKKFGETDVDFNAAYLNTGREDSARRASGGQAALSISHEFKNNAGVEAEISGQSLDDVQPRGLFALGAFTYKVNRRLTFDAGLRFGLNPEAPRVGVFAGFTIGVADLYKK
ncbi:MAG TPA: transporter [Pyrinomonadaceae bacterium]|jgi:hypothetical protein|nr:transporter [Pyrinomonadaceae bacterium]